MHVSLIISYHQVKPCLYVKLALSIIDNTMHAVTNSLNFIETLLIWSCTYSVVLFVKYKVQNSFYDGRGFNAYLAPDACACQTVMYEMPIQYVLEVVSYSNIPESRNDLYVLPIYILFCEILTRCAQRIRDFLIMRYINLHFTFLLYLLTLHYIQPAALPASAL